MPHWLWHFFFILYYHLFLRVRQSVGITLLLWDMYTLQEIYSSFNVHKDPI